MKLTLLSNQWQGVVRRAQQRRGIIDGLIRQWQRYREMVEKLRKWLLEVSHPVEVLQAGNTIPLQQARSMLDAVQLMEKVLQRQQGSYILTIEAGRQLLLSADGRAEVTLQTELTDIQDRWKQASTCLEEQKKELSLLLKDLENTFEGWTGDLAHLTLLRESLSCYISAEDLSVLQERIELLHRQWDEICHQVQYSLYT
ncbi:hypothetical protein XENOCAPTIV_002692 [Xenoophorus captivus]|uniref:Uncharacterized protein n=1 Tax=Xenoophorus captivus TaxID=1517983 RepID=A0ABV0QVX5_9TELE